MAATKNPRPDLSKTIFFVIMNKYEQWRKDRAMWEDWLKTRFSDKQLWQLAPEPRFTVGVIVDEMLGRWGQWLGLGTEIDAEVKEYKDWFDYYDGETKDVFKGAESRRMEKNKKPVRAAVQTALNRMIKSGALEKSYCVSHQTGKETKCYEPTQKAWDAWPKIKKLGRRRRR